MRDEINTYTVLRYLLHQVCRVQSMPGEVLVQPEGGVQQPLPGFSGSRLPSPYDPWKLPYLRVRQMIDSQDYLTDATPFCSSVRVRTDDGSEHGKPQLLPLRNEGFEQFFWYDKWFWKWVWWGAAC